MVRSSRLLAAALVAGGLVVVGSATPASAGVVASSSGTTIVVSMSGAGTATFNCLSGNATVNGLPTAPAVACSALTKVTVVGDGSIQTVVGYGLDQAAFSANPYLVAGMGAGSDTVFDTIRADTITMGAGDDRVYLARSVTNTSVDLGADTDQVIFDGSAAAETISLTSSGTSLALSDTGPGGTTSHSFASVEKALVRGNDGNDTISSAAVTLASTATFIEIQGFAGDDTMTTGPGGGFMYGGIGTNTFHGGSGGDIIVSSSDTDHIDQGAGNSNIYDQDSLHAGRSGIPNTGTGQYSLSFNHGDAVARVRWLPGTSRTQITTSLDRFGQPTLPSAFSLFGVFLGESVSLDDMGMGDVVALPGGRMVSVAGDSFDNDVMDITIPAGGWVQSGSPSVDGNVNPSDPAYGTIYYSDMGAVSVHGPWVNKDQGFAHRVTRDLVFRFLADGARTTLGTQLANGTKTRAQVVSSLMDSAEYRGLDVDRVFTKYLRRKVDPAGRTYWTNSLGSGKPLVKFRAQLFGSNEYFTKNGGTNASFVQAAYADVLGRSPDAAGKTYWTNKLNGGADRGSVALQFLSSTEARRNIVKDQFLRFLDRMPTDGESTSWVTTLAGPTGEQDLIAFLATSSSYYNRS